MSFFEHSGHSSFHDSHFAAVQGSIYINNYNDSARSSSGMMQLRKKNTDGWPESADSFEAIKAGDIKVIKTLRTQQLEMQIEDDSPDPGMQETNPFRIRISQRNNALKAVKVTRSVHMATIFGRGSEKFTVVSYEVVGGIDKNTFAVCKPEYDLWSQKRHAKLPQLFGVTRSSLPALIYHNARVNANDVFSHFQVTPAISSYLRILKLMDDEEVDSIAPEILGDLTSDSSWEFDFSTQSFCYSLDFPINTHIYSQVKSSNDFQHCATEYRGTLDYLRRPQIPPPALDNTMESRLDIVSYISQITGEYLDSISVLGRKDLNVDPVNIAFDGLISFGACFKMEWDNNRGPILASFQSLDLTPEWMPIMWSSTVDIEVTNWLSLNSQIQISFLNWQQGGDFHFRFSLALPRDMRRHLRDLLDHVDFEIKGQFNPLHISPTAPSVPIHLFIDPLKTEIINGLPCLKYPPEGPFMHWSFDPDGPTAPVDMDNYGLTSLKLELSAGTWWNIGDYQAVKEYLCSKGYDHYSTAYAVDHGYPLLTYRNPEEGAEEPIEEIMEAITTKMSSSTQDNFEVASRTSKLQQTKRIRSRIRQFGDHFAMRGKKD
ncbi:hypothetical protein WG66_003096 [Moniliophthora roreri]|nr:hypothetical protein WG66_003096 [Moniliophthora roreri]